MYTVERYSYPGEKESCEEKENRVLGIINYPYEAPACRNFSAVAVYFCPGASPKWGCL